MTRYTLLLSMAAYGGVSGTPMPALGQAPGEVLAQGIEAYQNIEYENAAALLRRLPGRGLPEPELARALVYLGAADLFRGRRDSAVAVFRRLIKLQPHYRPNPLVFPPEVTTVYDLVRRDSRVVGVTVPRDTQFTASVATFNVRLTASSSHQVDVALRREDGTPFRALYSGLVGDTLTVSWDGLDLNGESPAPGTLVLRVSSRAPSGAVVRLVQVPLHLRISPPDTLLWPPAPAVDQLLPERHRGVGPAVRALMGAALVSGAVLALPTVLGGRPDAHGARVAVAGTIGLTGVVGLVVKRPGRPWTANIRTNQATRAAWQRRVDAVRLQNAQTLRAVRLVVRAGEPNVMEFPGS